MCGDLGRSHSPRQVKKYTVQGAMGSSPALSSARRGEEMKPNLQAPHSRVPQMMDMLVEQSQRKVFVSLRRRAQQFEGSRSRDYGLSGCAG